MEIMKKELVKLITSKCEELGLNVLSNKDFKTKRMNNLWHDYYYTLRQENNALLLPSLVETQVLSQNHKGSDITIKFQDNERGIFMRISILKMVNSK